MSIVSPTTIRLFTFATSGGGVYPFMVTLKLSGLLKKLMGILSTVFLTILKLFITALSKSTVLSNFTLRFLKYGELPNADI